jgi:hypothetical protein
VSLEAALDTRAKLIGDATSAETQPHRLNDPTEGSAYATCSVPCTHLQRTDANDKALRQWSTADVLLTKPPMFVSVLFRFYGICRQNKEPTSGLEPLTPAPATSVRSVVAGVCSRLQNPHS